MHRKFLREHHRRQDKAANQYDPVSSFIPKKTEESFSEFSECPQKPKNIPPQDPHSVKCSDCSTMTISHNGRQWCPICGKFVAL